MEISPFGSFHQHQQMGIELGLSRINRLLGLLGNPHHSTYYIHVAGTNGKGSVTSYVASALQQRYKVGKFTSPHLIEKSDCISLNSKPLGMKEYAVIESRVLEINSKHEVHATEFEILTAVALEYFKQEQVELAVLEVGLGGRLDSTNVIPAEKVLCCGITKIGMDHEGILGNTLAQIAAEKAGIIKSTTVVDGSNDPQVLQVVQSVAGERPLLVTETQHRPIATAHWGPIDYDVTPLRGSYQFDNLSVAIGILDHVQSQFPLTRDQLIAGIRSTVWPGRLQLVEYPFGDKTRRILLDGAHNASAASELSKFLSAEYGSEPINFLIAITMGKNVDALMAMVRPQDSVFVTEFGDVDGMPWIKPTPSTELEQACLQYTRQVRVVPRDTVPDVPNLVVCGSLYLVGQLLRKANLKP